MVRLPTGRRQFLFLVLAIGFLPLIGGVLIFWAWVHWRHPVCWPLGGLHILLCTPLVIWGLVILLSNASRVGGVKKALAIAFVFLCNFPLALFLMLFSTTFVPRLVLDIENNSGASVLIESLEITGRTHPGFTLEDGARRKVILRPQCETESLTVRLRRQGGDLDEYRMYYYITNGFSEERATLRIPHDLVPELTG